MAKKVRLEKIVGCLTEEKEEEPEGEELGESNTGNVLLSLPPFFLIVLIPLHYSCILLFFFSSR